MIIVFMLTLILMVLSRWILGGSTTPKASGANEQLRQRVVIKWGGGLITDKHTLKRVRLDVIGELADQIIACHQEDIDVVLVHGAGSFGHLKAKQWRLAEGHLPDANFGRPNGQSQEDGVEAVRKDMLELNSHIMDALAKRNIPAIAFPPHQWAKGTGLKFEGDIRLLEVPQGVVLVTFGDVVDCKPPQRFGILSGDDLVARLALKLPRVKRVVFAIGGVDGVLAKPPSEATQKDLLEVLTAESIFKGEHQSNIDVTGGIGLKVHRSLQVAKQNIEVTIVNGQCPERVLAACCGRPTRGTKIIHSTSVKR